MRAQFSVGTLTPGNPSFSTSFPTTQNPLASPWSFISTSGFTAMQVASAGLCCGTNTGSTFDDSIASLAGLGFENYSRIRQTAVIHVAASLPNDGISREIEFHSLIHGETTSAIFTYETDIPYNSTIVPFVRWNGTSGSFTVASGAFTLDHNLADGDVLVHELDIPNTTITLFQGGINCGSVNYGTDHNLTTQDGGAVYTSGKPGIGAFRRPGANSTDVGFKSLTVVTF